MIWKKFTVETTEECEDLVAEFLNEKGAEGVLVEDKAPLSADDLKAMYVDVPLMRKKMMVRLMYPVSYSQISILRP